MSKVSANVERLELPDGDFVDVHWSRREKGSIVFILHGLGGNIESAYAKGMFHALEGSGFRPVFMHFRGCSGEPNRHEWSYHSGQTDDFRFLIDTVMRRFPDSLMHAVGFSLGANVLLKFLGEEGKQCQLKAAVAISSPLVLGVAAKRLNIGSSKIYQRYLLGRLKKSVVQKRKQYPSMHTSLDLESIHTLREFDDAVTAPLAGFKDAEDYYTQCSSRQFLSKIKTPTHIIHSSDDPFFYPDVIPEPCEMSSSVVFEKTNAGGHVAFVSGSHPFSSRYWLEERVPELLRQ